MVISFWLKKKFDIFYLNVGEDEKDLDLEERTINIIIIIIRKKNFKNLPSIVCFLFTKKKIDLLTVKYWILAKGHLANASCLVIKQKKLR